MLGTFTRLSRIGHLGLVCVVWLMTTSLVSAAEGESGADLASSIIHFLFTSVTGYVLIGIYFFFVGMMVWLLMDVRGGAMMPPDLVEAIEDGIAKRQFRQAFETVKAENSFFARVMTAGMARLQHGLEEARDAVHAMLDNLRSKKKGLVGYIAIVGTLGPLIGLVGTVSGMIQSFAELGRGGTPDPAKLADGISHALNATLVGIFLSCLAIPAYTFFNNRLDRIINDISLMADDLLVQMYFASRQAGAPARPGAPASADQRPAEAAAVQAQPRTQS
ncbi:MAG: MotA/TolQ/ExbB proton channel family protein [Gemmatales bacterium]|nr:MotA/TolQ/ExbB proton channel family protein [Gemmatales bacterium]MDW7993071.1 MotA/TolQ/ExbB proton channel family protein [Gemmatales bacterium]